MSNKKYFYIDSIVNGGSFLFHRHIRWQVKDDKDTLLKLLKANDTKSLDFYEQYYKELCTKNQDPQQRDIMNASSTVIGTEHIPEFTEALSISELHDDFKARQSSWKKAGWASRKKSQKT